MFQPKLYNNLVSSILGSVRFMCYSNRIPKTPTKNPFLKEKLPDLPNIELITSKALDIEAHLSSRKVKYGDYDFIECPEGYILCYIHAYLRKKEPHNVFYGGYYGAKHPLNVNGPVNGKQTLSHAKETAILRLIETFPNIETKKLCVCTDCTRTIKVMGRLKAYSENGYRSTTYGTVLHTKDTYEVLNKVLRLRNDLQLRFLYTPSDVVHTMKEALKLATLASK